MKNLEFLIDRHTKGYHFFDFSEVGYKADGGTEAIFTKFHYYFSHN